MESVKVKFQECIKKVHIFKEIPTITEDTLDEKIVEIFEPSYENSKIMEIGEVCVEELKEDAGTMISVIMPNGASFPVGDEKNKHVGPPDYWFPILKNTLRSWLVLCNEARIIRICTEMINFKLNSIAKKYNWKKGFKEQVKNQFRQYYEEILHELKSGWKEEDIQKSFLEWISNVSHQTNNKQEQVIMFVQKWINIRNDNVKIVDSDNAIFKGKRKRLVQI